jgi:hypothetical protein
MAIAVTNALRFARTLNRTESPVPPLVVHLAGELEEILHD